MEYAAKSKSTPFMCSQSVSLRKYVRFHWVCDNSLCPYLTVNARNGILKEILSLKRKVRKSNVSAIHKTIRNRRMKTTVGRDDDKKSNGIPDYRRTRKYLKITSIDSNASAIDSVAASCDQFKFVRWTSEQVLYWFAVKKEINAKSRRWWRN